MRYLVAAIAGVLLFTSNSSFAASREQKIQRLMEVQGFVKMFDEQLASNREYSRKQGNDMLNRLMIGLAPDDAFRKKFQGAMEGFVKDTQAPWGSKEMSDAWYRLYGGKFTDAELDQLLAFYTSPVAQKEVTVTRDAMTEFGREFQDKYKPTRERALSAYVKRLEVLVKECNCKK